MNMNRVVLTAALVLLGVPAFAQEIDLGLGGDASSLLNIPVPTGRGTAPRGAPPAAGARGTPPRGAPPSAAPVDRLVRLRELLANANIPLAPQQETGLNAMVNGEIPRMRQSLQAKIADIQRGRGEAATPGPPAANLPGMEELAPEIIKLNDQLLGKIAGAPLLTPQQQALIKKLHRDQVKSRGGFQAIKLTMEDAGAPFSAEQIAQIQPLFEEQAQIRDQSKRDQIQRENLAKILKLLSPPQRAALLAVPAKPQ